MGGQVAGSVYKHLRPLTKQLGIRFTPHMARWTFATDLNDCESSTLDIMNAGTWTSTKSVEWYIQTNRPRVRAVLGKLPAPDAAAAGEYSNGGSLGVPVFKVMKS